MNSIQKVRFSLIPALLAVGVMGFSGHFARADAGCACDAKCSEACAEGHGEKCKCTTCDCSKGKGCKHGKCNPKKHQEGNAEPSHP